MSHPQSIRASKHALIPQISPDEYQLILDLRDRSPAQNPPKLSLTLGDRVADRVAMVMGSWTFILLRGRSYCSINFIGNLGNPKYCVSCPALGSLSLYSLKSDAIVPGCLCCACSNDESESSVGDRPPRCQTRLRS